LVKQFTGVCSAKGESRQKLSWRQQGPNEKKTEANVAPGEERAAQHKTYGGLGTSMDGLGVRVIRGMTDPTERNLRAKGKRETKRVNGNTVRISKNREIASA